MKNANFIDSLSFIFTPFHPPNYKGEPGDSGALELATSKHNSEEQYVIKYGYPEIACNEFMYHKVTEALGLYTQEVKMIMGKKKYHRAAAIRYVPNARKFYLETADSENFKAFFEFEALYVILNEGDSHEYYLDEQNKLFKLDNADSFTVQETTIRRFMGDPIGYFFLPDIEAPLNSVGYNWYGMMLDKFTQEYGQAAADAYLSVIQQFAEFDEDVLEEAYAALDKQYPRMLKEYYARCISIRKETCRKFLSEVGL